MTMNKISFEVKIENKTLETTVFIDGERVVWNTVDPTAFMFDVFHKGINTPYYVKDKTKSHFYNLCISTFEPFTCGCGVSGCAGIWAGIMSKHRKKTVEWKTKVDDGYGFLKRFYSFDRNQYEEAVYNLYMELVSLIEKKEVINSYSTDDDMLLEDYFKEYCYWSAIENMYEKGFQNGFNRKIKQPTNMPKRYRKRIR